MTMVLVPAGTRSTRASRRPSPAGGRREQQSKLIGPPWCRRTISSSRQDVESCISATRTRATAGNANRIATYLDARIPEAWSDLETVYLNLDLLYLPALSARCRALDRIGPARYERLTADALETGGMTSDAVDQRVFCNLP
jgi:hypothetical protein